MQSQQGTNLFNQVCDMIQSILDNNGLLGLHCFTLSLSFCLVEKTFLLGGLVLWPVFQQQLEQAGGCINIRSLALIKW